MVGIAFFVFCGCIAQTKRRSGTSLSYSHASLLWYLDTSLGAQNLCEREATLFLLTVARRCSFIVERRWWRSRFLNFLVSDYQTIVFSSFPIPIATVLPEVAEHGGANLSGKSLQGLSNLPLSPRTLILLDLHGGEGYVKWASLPMITKGDLLANSLSYERGKSGHGFVIGK